MRFYGVQDPYEKQYDFYRSEVICPWVVTRREIVQTWPLEEVGRDHELSTIGTWVKKAVIPAVHEHELADLERATRKPNAGALLQEQRPSTSAAQAGQAGVTDLEPEAEMQAADQLVLHLGSLSCELVIPCVR